MTDAAAIKKAPLPMEEIKEEDANIKDSLLHGIEKAEE